MSPGSHGSAGAGGSEGFEADVAEVLGRLEPGDVVTYGEVASEAGHPGAARAVGRLLATGGEAYPWWRVVTATGRLVPGQEDRHARLLAQEGIGVHDGKVRQGTSRNGRARR